MKSIRTPLILLVILYAGFVGFVLSSQGALPDRLATHFGASGKPDGWMSRDSHIRFMLTFGVGFPLLVPAVVFCCRFLPAALVNIPHRDYWLSPEHRQDSLNFLFAHSLWLGCAAALFVAGCHWMVVDANRHVPARLSTGLLVGVTLGFLLLLGIWIAMLLRRFMKLPVEVKC